MILIQYSLIMIMMIFCQYDKDNGLVKMSIFIHCVKVSGISKFLDGLVDHFGLQALKSLRRVQSGHLMGEEVVQQQEGHNSSVTGGSIVLGQSSLLDHLQSVQRVGHSSGEPSQPSRVRFLSGQVNGRNQGKIEGQFWQNS